MLNQRLQQKLLQKLSPQQILLMKLLQIPTIALEQRIKQEIEENPALEIEEGADESDSSDDEYDASEEDDFDADAEQEYDSTDDEFDLDDYIPDDDDIPDYRLNANNRSSDDRDNHDIPFSQGMSFQEILIQQLGFRKLDERKYKIGLYIIGNIDDSGYLNRQLDAMTDDLLFVANLKTNKSEMLETLRIIQDFDPPGVGARNLQECLLIQLEKLQKDNPLIDYRLPIMIIDRFFNEFTKSTTARLSKEQKFLRKH